MSPIQVFTVVGARPQFIKAAVLSRLIALAPDVEEVLVHTGQHYDTNMSEQFFTELDIPHPAHNLGVGSASHGVQTARMLEGLEALMGQHHPDVVLVYGDTNSTLAAALAAAKLHIPVAHVEAGLRSFNRAMPEEINRVLTDHVSKWLFTPTTTATVNLQHEGVSLQSIHEVGDVMCDAAHFYAVHAPNNFLEALGLTTDCYTLATVHRAENTDDLDRLQLIFEGLKGLAKKAPVVLPLHPRTRQVLMRAGWFESVQESLHVLEPVGYLQMIALLRGARLVVTDSGGVQKEAFFHKTPCVTIRHETEWVELISSGWNQLAPLDEVSALRASLIEAFKCGRPSQRPPLIYGDGHAGDRILSILRRG